MYSPQKIANCEQNRKENVHISFSLQIKGKRKSVLMNENIDVK